MRNWQNKGNKAGRLGFGQGVLEARSQGLPVVVLGSDITASVGLKAFKERFADDFISLGIAEQNVAGVAAGLALSGKIPVFSTYGVFSAMRDLDQIRLSLCYNELHALIGGAHAGVSVGPDGATHQALEDLAVMRVLPNMTVLSPCDYTQAALLTTMAIRELSGPVYIRYGREPMPDFTSPEDSIEIGKAQKMKAGNDISIVATGHLVWEALLAAALLEKEGIDAEVLNIHTIKPIDKQALIASAQKTGHILTAEEHQKIGGLGSAVAEVLSTHYPCPISMIGIDDVFGQSGEPLELMRYYGLTAEHLAARAKEILHHD